jgi:hypothetical protein
MPWQVIGKYPLEIQFTITANSATYCGPRKKSQFYSPQLWKFHSPSFGVSKADSKNCRSQKLENIQQFEVVNPIRYNEKCAESVQMPRPPAQVAIVSTWCHSLTARVITFLKIRCNFENCKLYEYYYIVGQTDLHYAREGILPSYYGYVMRKKAPYQANVNKWWALL